MIKFRAWHRELNMMFEVKSLVFTLNLATIASKNDLVPSRTCSFDDIILMQSTGLFDKNGVEIFENDTVKVDGRKAEVVKFGQITHEEDFGGFAIYQGFSLLLGGGYPETIMNELEVVGNVYENHELLVDNFEKAKS